MTKERKVLNLKLTKEQVDQLKRLAEVKGTFIEGAELEGDNLTFSYVAMNSQLIHLKK